MRILEGDMKRISVSFDITDYGTPDFLAMLEDIKKQGNDGHSFDIIVDPTGDEPHTYFIDGDGAFTLFNLKVKEQLEESKATRMSDDYEIHIGSDKIKVHGIGKAMDILHKHLTTSNDSINIQNISI